MRWCCPCLRGPESPKHNSLKKNRRSPPPAHCDHVRSAIGQHGANRKMPPHPLHLQPGLLTPSTGKSYTSTILSNPEARQISPESQKPDGANNRPDSLPWPLLAYEPIRRQPHRSVSPTSPASVITNPAAHSSPISERSLQTSCLVAENPAAVSAGATPLSPVWKERKQGDLGRVNHAVELNESPERRQTTTSTPQRPSALPEANQRQGGFDNGAYLASPPTASNPLAVWASRTGRGADADYEDIDEVAETLRTSQTTGRYPPPHWVESGANEPEEGRRERQDRRSRPRTRQSYPQNHRADYVRTIAGSTASTAQTQQQQHPCPPVHISNQQPHASHNTRLGPPAPNHFDPTAAAHTEELRQPQQQRPKKQCLPSSSIRELYEGIKRSPPHPRRSPKSQQGVRNSARLKREARYINRSQILPQRTSNLAAYSYPSDDSDMEPSASPVPRGPPWDVSTADDDDAAFSSLHRPRKQSPGAFSFSGARAVDTRRVPALHEDDSDDDGMPTLSLPAAGGDSSPDEQTGSCETSPRTTHNARRQVNGLEGSPAGAHSNLQPWHSQVSFLNTNFMSRGPVSSQFGQARPTSFNSNRISEIPKEEDIIESQLKTLNHKHSDFTIPENENPLNMSHQSEPVRPQYTSRLTPSKSDYNHRSHFHSPVEERRGAEEMNNMRKHSSLTHLALSSPAYRPLRNSSQGPELSSGHVLDRMRVRRRTSRGSGDGGSQSPSGSLRRGSVGPHQYMSLSQLARTQEATPRGGSDRSSEAGSSHGSDPPPPADMQRYASLSQLARQDNSTVRSPPNISSPRERNVSTSSDLSCGSDSPFRKSSQSSGFRIDSGFSGSPGPLSPTGLSNISGSSRSPVHSPRTPQHSAPPPGFMKAYASLSQLAKAGNADPVRAVQQPAVEQRTPVVQQRSPSEEPRSWHTPENKWARRQFTPTAKPQLKVYPTPAAKETSEDQVDIIEKKFRDISMKMFNPTKPAVSSTRPRAPSCDSLDSLEEFEASESRCSSQSPTPQRQAPVTTSQRPPRRTWGSVTDSGHSSSGGGPNNTSSGSPSPPSIGRRKTWDLSFQNGQLSLIAGKEGSQETPANGRQRTFWIALDPPSKV